MGCADCALCRLCLCSWNKWLSLITKTLCPPLNAAQVVQDSQLTTVEEWDSMVQPAFILQALLLLGSTIQMPGERTQHKLKKSLRVMSLFCTYLCYLEDSPAQLHNRFMIYIHVCRCKLVPRERYIASLRPCLGSISRSIVNLFSYKLLFCSCEISINDNNS